MELVNIKAPKIVWVALKIASARLNTSIVDVLARLCQGDTEALAAVQRAMREEESEQ